MGAAAAATAAISSVLRRVPRRQGDGAATWAACIEAAIERGTAGEASPAAPDDAPPALQRYAGTALVLVALHAGVQGAERRGGRRLGAVGASTDSAAPRADAGVEAVRNLVHAVTLTSGERPGAALPSLAGAVRCARPARH